MLLAPLSYLDYLDYQKCGEMTDLGGDWLHRLHLPESRDYSISILG